MSHSSRNFSLFFWGGDVKNLKKISTAQIKQRDFLRDSNDVSLYVESAGKY